MMLTHGIHIMVIDGAIKALFRNRGSAVEPDLERTDYRVNPALKTAELGSDKPGRSFQSAGSARSAYDATDYHQQEEDRFANAAADQLNALLTDGVQGILIAPPHVFGVMRKRLKDDVRARLILEIDKDYAGRTATAITELLVSI